MAPKDAEMEIPQGYEMQARVKAKSSVVTGQLEDQTLDLDARTMALLGKKQRLKRNFGYLSLVAFSTTLIASWESFACTFQSGLVNGGSASLIYGLMFSILGSLAVAASLAEMASMAPTSGGQYHWVAILAPARYATIFSYAAGWTTTFARLAVAASAADVAGVMIQGLIALNNEAYAFERWHGTILFWAVIAFSALVNILGIRYFPHIETVAFIFHICFFFVFLVPLVYLAPQSTSKFVFADFENSSGWNSDGVSFFIGLLTSAWSFVGIDGTSHMAEEVQNSAIVVPRSMILGIFISGIFTVGLSIALLFSIGDVMAALTTPTKFPVIEIFYNATHSKAATTAMMTGLISTIIFGTFGLLASASRLTWAFARDKGFPFPTYFAHVDKHYWIPVRAIVLVAFIMILLGLVNIVSSIAFNALTTLALMGHYSSYLLPITLLVMRRFGKKEIPFGPFTLGRWGLPINLISITYSLSVIVFMSFPPYQPVTPENMNYASLIFGFVLLLSLILWYGTGRKIYKGPVRDMIENMHLS